MRVLHTHYVMDVCNLMQPIILLPPRMGMLFMLVMLTRLFLSELIFNSFFNIFVVSITSEKPEIFVCF